MYDVTVIKGKGLGSTIGFPTLNCISDQKISECFGVYIVKCNIGREIFHGVANWGGQPTLDVDSPLLEVHIINERFKENNSPSELKVELIEFIRNTEKHESIEKLQRMIGNDVKYARNFLFNKANS